MRVRRKVVPFFFFRALETVWVRPFTAPCRMR